MAGKQWLAMIGIFCNLAHAGIYRCEQDGKLQFSDKPCVAGQEALAVAPLNTMETSVGDRALAQQFDDDTAALHQSRKVPPRSRSEPAHATKAREPRPRKDPQKASHKSPKRAPPTKAPPPPAKLRLSPPRR